MKGLAVVMSMFAIIVLANQNYDIDLLKGKVQFSSKEDEEIVRMFEDKESFKELTYAERQVHNAKLKSINAKTATDLVRIESDTLENVTPEPVRLHRKNRLKNGDLVVVKRRVFGNNTRDGHRWVFYFYGANDLGSMTDIMKNELGLDNKFTMSKYKRGNKYSWMEVRSRFITLR